MLIHDGRTSSSVIDRATLGSTFDLYVDLGIRPSSLTFFSDLGIDLYVDLPIRSQTSDRHDGDGGTQSTREIWSGSGSGDAAADHLRESSDLLVHLNVDDPDASVKQIENTDAIPQDGLTTKTLVDETYTDADVEKFDAAKSFIDTDEEKVEVLETCTGADMEAINVVVFTGTDVENICSLNTPETFTGTDVETVDADTFTDTDVEKVDVISLQNAQSAACSWSQKTDDDISRVRASELTTLARENSSWRSVDPQAVAMEPYVWDDAEIGAIHGLTKLRNESRLKRCNRGEATFSNLESITPSSDRMRESATFPDDELYHLRIRLDYLSKRVRKAQASVQQLKSAPDIKHLEPWKIEVCKHQTMCKLKRVRPLSLKSPKRDCECIRPLQRAFRSVRSCL